MIRSPITLIDPVLLCAIICSGIMYQPQEATLSFVTFPSVGSSRLGAVRRVTIYTYIRALTTGDERFEVFRG